MRVPRRGRPPLAPRTRGRRPRRAVLTPGGRRVARPGPLLAGVPGLLLTAAGAGLVVAHVAVATYRPDSAGDVVGDLVRPVVAGAVVAVLVGTALLVVSFAAWWRAAGRRRPVLRTALRVALVLGTVAALVLVGVPTGAAVAALLPPRGLDRGPSPAERGLAGSDVRFTTTDGVGLAAWWAPGTNGAAVVVVPGTFGTRASVVDQAVVLARHGYGVLLLDPRGNGASDGPGQGLGWYLERDLSAAVSYLLGRPEVDGGRVAVLGESLGGEGAIGAAATDPRIRAVVAEGVTGRTAADDGTRPSGPTGPLVAAGWAVLDAEVRLLSLAPRPAPLVRAAADARSPVLLVAAGTQDREVRTARQVLARAAPPGRVVVDVVPGAGHTGGHTTDPRGWEATVVGFLDRHLGR